MSSVCSSCGEHLEKNEGVHFDVVELPSADVMLCDYCFQMFDSKDIKVAGLIALRAMRSYANTAPDIIVLSIVCSEDKCTLEYIDSDKPVTVTFELSNRVLIVSDRDIGLNNYKDFESSIVQAAQELQSITNCTNVQFHREVLSTRPNRLGVCAVCDMEFFPQDFSDDDYAICSTCASVFEDKLDVPEVRLLVALSSGLAQTKDIPQPVGYFKGRNPVVDIAGFGTIVMEIPQSTGYIVLNVVSSGDKCLELFDYFSTSQGVFSASVACGRHVRFERSDSFDNSVEGGSTHVRRMDFAIGE